jgi:hypothetical protein
MRSPIGFKGVGREPLRAFPSLPNMKLRMLFAGATLVGLLMATDVRAALVTNGDFNNTGGTWTNNTGLGSNDWQTSGNVAIPGWTNVSGFANEFWVTTPNNYDGLTASPGNGSTYFVDLTGQANSNPFGGLKQTITTVANDHYILSFALGASTQWNPVSNSMAASALTASATGLSLLNSQLFSLTPNSLNSWTTETLSFTADSTSTVIEFLGDSANVDSKYIGLDNVSVNLSSAVPEASTWAMMILGFCGIGLMAHRRRNKMTPNAA